MKKIWTHGNFQFTKAASSWIFLVFVSLIAKSKWNQNDERKTVIKEFMYTMNMEAATIFMVG